MENNENLKNDLNPENDQTNGLLKAVKTGIASSEQIAEWSRFLSIGMASDLLKGQSFLLSRLEGYMSLQDKLMNRLDKLLEVEVETLELEDVLKLMDFTHKHTVSILDLQRKIVQGKSLLSDYPQLTQEEKSMLTLIKQLKTPEEKKMFVDTLKSVVVNQEANEALKKEKSSKSLDDDDFEMPS